MTSDTDGNFEAFDNGIMNGDFEAADIKQTARQDAIVCVNNRCGIIDGTCFVAGTLVKTIDGQKAIEEIKIGDLVHSYDTKQQVNKLAKVKNVFKRGTAQIYEVLIGKDTLKTTAEHPFYTNLGWMPAEELKSGINVLSLIGDFLAVDTILTYDSLATVYNFEVEEQHNYYVGINGILVHNTYHFRGKVGLGNNDLSVMTMDERRFSTNPNTGRNFATIEYRDNNGRVQYESFRSLNTGPSGHTEQVIFRFLDEEDIPYDNLLRLHSELIPCIRCTETILDKLRNTKTETQITWDFDESDRTARLEYINSL